MVAAVDRAIAGWRAALGDAAVSMRRRHQQAGPLTCVAVVLP
jgi:hypothetical protein